MTVKEMHIEVNQSLQKMAANKTLKFQPSEIDWVLNKMQLRFVENLLRPSAKSGTLVSDQMSVDRLRNLEKEFEKPALYMNSSMVQVILPPDYLHLIESQSMVHCEVPKEFTSVEKKVIFQQLQMIDASNPAPYYNSCVISVSPIDNPSNPILADVQSMLGANNFFNGNGAINFNFQKTSDIQFHLPALLWSLRQQGVEAFFGEYQGLYKANAIMIEDVTSITTTSDALQGTGSVATGKSIGVTRRYPKTSTTGKYKLNRQQEYGNTGVINQTAFHKTQSLSPITEIRRQNLIVHQDNFTVSKVLGKYIRRPKPIYLLLGSDCELPEETHQTICDLAVEYIQIRIGDKEGLELTKTDDKINF